MAADMALQDWQHWLEGLQLRFITLTDYQNLPPLLLSQTAQLPADPLVIILEPF